MARVLRVSVFGYYAWRSRPASAHAQADAALLRRIRTIHAGSYGTCGAPRGHAELQAQGMTIARKRVARLMHQTGLQGVSRRRFPTTTRREPTHRPANDLVGCVFTAPAPNLLWVAGDRWSSIGHITYVPTAAGLLFLAVVLDASSRRIVGWAMANDLRTQLALDALNMAVTTRRPADVLHHSDQGSQHTSLASGMQCQEAGARPSTGSVGDAYDNALAEAFLATLDCASLDRRRFRTQAEARMAVLHLIEGFHNPTRRHPSLGSLSPIECRAKKMLMNT